MSLCSHAVDVEIRNIVFKQAIDTNGSCVLNHPYEAQRRSDVNSFVSALKWRQIHERDKDVVDEETRWYLVEFQVAFSTNKNNFYYRVPVGRDSSVGIATALWDGRSGDRIPVEARFSAPAQTGPGAHPAFYTMGTGSFPGGRAAGAWRWRPTPSSAEVNERVDLYLYSPSGSSWHITGWTLSRTGCTWKFCRQAVFAAPC
jgi:hypothetical protein